MMVYHDRYVAVRRRQVFIGFGYGWCALLRKPCVSVCSSWSAFLPFFNAYVCRKQFRKHLRQLFRVSRFSFSWRDRKRARQCTVAVQYISIYVRHYWRWIGQHSIYQRL